MKKRLHRGLQLGSEHARGILGLMVTEDPPIERLRLGVSRLTGQEHTVGRFALEEPLAFATHSIALIADWTGTSEATVVRAARSLGFKGARDMKQACADLVKSSSDFPGLMHSRLRTLHSSTENSSVAAVAQRVSTDVAIICERTAELFKSQDVQGLVEDLAAANRLVFYGLGTAKHISDYAGLEMRRIGRNAISVSGSGHTAADSLIELDNDDFLVILAPRFLLPDVEAFVRLASQLVAGIVVLSQDKLAGDTVLPAKQVFLPSTVSRVATESVAVWFFLDVVIAECARRDPERAMSTRSAMQKMRDRFVPRNGPRRL